MPGRCPRRCHRRALATDRAWALPADTRRAAARWSRAALLPLALAAVLLGDLALAFDLYKYSAGATPCWARPR